MSASAPSAFLATTRTMRSFSLMGDALFIADLDRKTGMRATRLLAESLIIPLARVYLRISRAVAVSSDPWKLESVSAVSRVSPSGNFISIQRSIMVLPALTMRFNLILTKREYMGTSAMVDVLIVSVSSLMSSKQVTKGIVVGLSQSAALTSAIAKSVSITRFARVIPEAALIMGLALRTILPKFLRRPNLNLRMF